MTDAGLSPFFAAYSGISMSPLLQEPAVLEVVPYGDRPVQGGDVIFFVPPSADQPIVHRVVRVTPSGIVTRGDNSTLEDPYLLRQEHIRGRVVATLCGTNRRKISGGLRGRVAGNWLRWLRFALACVSRLLHTPYYALSDRGVMVQLLPRQFRARVVAFRFHGQERYQLQIGQRAIGLYDDRTGSWRIRRPFRLFVDKKRLSVPPDRDRNSCR